MKSIFLLYLLNTILFAVPLVKQFLIIVRSPSKDKKLFQKVVVFICCLCMMAAMWLCYLKIRGAAWVFFLVAITIIIWSYRNEKFKK
jgi:hypothetical protein